MRAADVLKDCDVVVASASGNAFLNEIEGIALDVFPSQRAGGNGKREFANIFSASVAACVDRAASDCVVIGLTHVRAERTDKVKMRARFE